MSLFSELRRRNVIRVALAYLVVGWLALQVSDVLVDALELPSVWSRGVLALLLVGFIPVMMFAWVYQLTPDGLMRDGGAQGDQAASSAHLAKKLDVAVIVLLVLAIAMMVFKPFGSDQGPAAGQAAAQPAASPVADAADSRPEAAMGTDSSVAVLAFENMSPDAENAYFAEGISEEILNLLARIDGLQVASRTSAFSFAGTDTPIPVIAEQLVVANVLEGSVRRQGNRVRITAQLIDARTDKHLWSDTFDRELDDIFVVQEEIARAIASELETTLGISAIRHDAPTRNMQAYELFLRGRQLFYQRGDALRQGLDDLRAAVEKDPEFSEAWAYLAATAGIITGYEDFTPEQQSAYHQEARRAAQRALELDPESGLAVAMLGQLEEDHLKSLELMDRAVALAPGDAGLIMWAGSERIHRGVYLEEALAMLERAYRLDPLVGINNGILGVAYLANGQFELGQRHILRAGELGWAYPMRGLQLARLARGESAQAIADHDKWVQAVGDDWSDDRRALMDALRRIMDGTQDADAFRRFERSLPAQSRDIGLILTSYLMLGEANDFFDVWNAEIDKGDTNLYIFRTVFIPGGQFIVEHPRFLGTTERLGLIPFWEVHGYPMNCERIADAGGDRLACANWPR